MRRSSMALGFAILMAACVEPTAPSAPPLPSAVPTYTLSGVVFAPTPTGLAPVEGVGVRADSGGSRLDATTDNNGSYTITGVYAGTSSVSASKEGYETDRRTVTISGDTRLDLRIIRRATYTLSGVVSEETATGWVAVEGVLVEEYDEHGAATTDGTGFYRISGLRRGVPNVGFNKEGYQFQSRSVAIDDDTRLDVQLVRR